ncbi:PREDICTED: interferon regulatory factor 9 [Nanorana parkeri]|uniref:interferon regulatory factor 9 n=1 Tax=Nanorana parkeri TaxID=125878 RepID=UPI0008549B91|nr:PREDICTED: interferon regulatory factor 9 [Nanorana parkeri]
MAKGEARCARKLKPWLVEQVDSGKYPGLMWDDEEKTCFRIPWKHAGKQDFRHDEDAAIFKAWAQYKNKYKNGDKEDAAAWKTRLRCALNKSLEFQERPERSQLDISEPYKVYKIVPPEEQGDPQSGKLTQKRKTSADLKAKSCDKVDQVEKKSKHVSLKRLPEVQRFLGTLKRLFFTVLVRPHIFPLLLSAARRVRRSPEMQVTVLYSGVEVSNLLIRSGECKLSAKAPTQCFLGEMEHVLLPLPIEPLDQDTQKKTGDLLKFLQAGVMLASNIDGIFAQRQKSCSGRVYWTGPCTNSQGTINKLERDKHVKLFDTQKFLKELELYRTNGGNPPEYQVTLCFGEEFSDRDPTEDKLITAKIEQALASELVQQATENLYAAHVQDPVKVEPPSPYLIQLMPVDTSDSMYT